MFVGRKRELAIFEQCYRSEKFECLVLYGRRRVGKTALIREFIRNRRCVFFTGVETTSEENLNMLSQSIWLCDHEDGEWPIYPSFDAAFKAIANMCNEQKLIVVLDEYPYLAKSYPAISSILQKNIDLYYQSNGNLMLVLCGSSMSFMEHQVMGYQSPLYGRRTAQLKLEPFKFFEIPAFYTTLPAESMAVVYGVTGGIPKYIQFFDENKSIQENLCEQFLTTSGYLYEEPSNLLKQELREPAIYHAMIRAIASGQSKMSSIANALGMSSSSLSPYLSKLQELGIIQKKCPVPDTGAKKSIYEVADMMFKFWYLTVPGQNNLIQRSLSERAYKNIIPTLETYMGKVFEQICVDYMWKEYDNLPVQFTEIGTWWGANRNKKQTEEIDIVATDGNSAIFCECKWRNKTITEDVLQILIERSMLIDMQHRYYILFSKSNFSQECRKAANRLGIQLIQFEEMMA
ncbi:MAG: ATP-binding protein [Proteobacteria bacterium]|nr:ATP-binding protein [Pseudomonadota bacterium]